MRPVRKQSKLVTTGSIRLTKQRTNMKENRLSKMLAVGAISAVALTTAVAHETTTVTRSTDPVTGTTTTDSATTTSVGTIPAAPASDYISFRTTTTADAVTD